MDSPFDRDRAASGPERGKPQRRETESRGEAKGVQVIARAAQILQALERDPGGLSLGEIAARVNLPRSTVQRIVAALARENLLISATPSARVRLGPALLRLASAARLETAEFLRPFLEALSKQVNETVDLAALANGKVVFIDQVLANHRLQAVSGIGMTFPLHCTANGKAFLAAMDPAQAQRLAEAEAASGGDRASFSWKRLAAELETVRTAGIAFDREEYTTGICAVGTAIRIPSAEMVAVTIPVPTHRFQPSEARLVAALKATAAEIHKLLRGR
jgi:DNA-binding IclR family transcriptional regulator